MKLSMNNEYAEQIKNEYEKIPKVRDYTEKERAIIECETNTPTERILKVIYKHQIDKQRYESFKKTNPEKAEHMTKMQTASQIFATETIQTIIDSNPGVTFDETGYIDTKSLPNRQLPTIADVEYIQRPA